MINPSFPTKALIALFVALAAALPARAQNSPGSPPESAEERVRATIETPYFQTLLRNFAESVRKDAEQACLQAKAFDDSALIARGQALFQRYGVQMTKLLDEGFDRAAYEAALSASAGPGALAAMERLKRNPDVITQIALDWPAQLARFADRLVEEFDRYVLIKRIKLYPVGPIARGQPDLKENPTQAAEAAVDKFLDEHLTPQVERYAELADAAEAASQKAVKREIALKLGPTAYFGGVERDLAELCIGSR
jgi:hypothetical protein